MAKRKAHKRAKRARGGVTVSILTGNSGSVLIVSGIPGKEENIQVALPLTSGGLPETPGTNR